MQLLPALLLLAATVEAHYTFPRLIVDGKVLDPKDWTYVRRTKNDNTKQGLSSPTGADIRCYQAGTTKDVAPVTAGSVVSFVSTQQINHPGPMSYYMAKVPEGQAIDAWNADGKVWFKVFSSMPTITADKQMKWAQPPEGKSDPKYYTFSFTIPKNTPSGDYLLRGEQIALHIPGQPQIYLACAQIRLTGGGSGTPGPLVAFPGAYSASDPGITVNINSPAKGDYVPPGPAAWTG